MNEEILILRDPRESAKKCSLTPLRGKQGIRFVPFHRERRLDAGSRIFLDPGGELLSPQDLELAPDGILLIDCSWRRVASLLAVVDGELLPRRLPELQTAYPRRSKTFEDPSAGLASVEALHAAMCLLGRPRPDLLDDYYWRERFLELNPGL
jgi:pre-rRNA-processing protein TSR3